MNRRTRIAAAAAGGIVALGAVVAVGIATSTSTGAASGPAPTVAAGPLASPTASTPTATPTSAPTAQPAAPATIDPYYGDVVITSAATQPAAFASGLTVELVSVTASSTTSSGIGSTGGAAVDVALLVTNTSGATIALSPVVNAYVGDDRAPLTPDHDSPIGSSIAAAAQSTGSYTFAVDDSSSVIWITVSTGPDSGLVVFEYHR